MQYNLFAYYFNNSVNLSDETGNWSGAGKVAIDSAVDGFGLAFPGEFSTIRIIKKSLKRTNFYNFF